MKSLRVYRLDDPKGLLFLLLLPGSRSKEFDDKPRPTRHFYDITRVGCNLDLSRPTVSGVPKEIRP